MHDECNRYDRPILWGAYYIRTNAHVKKNVFFR